MFMLNLDFHLLAFEGFAFGSDLSAIVLCKVGACWGACE